MAEAEVVTLTLGSQFFITLDIARKRLVYRCTLLSIDRMEDTATIGVELEILHRVQGVT